jgi:hypothetical protein
VQFSKRLKARNLKSDVLEAELWNSALNHAIPDPELRGKGAFSSIDDRKISVFIPASRNALIIRNFFPVEGKQLKVWFSRMAAYEWHSIKLRIRDTLCGTAQGDEVSPGMANHDQGPGWSGAGLGRARRTAKLEFWRGFRPRELQAGSRLPGGLAH